MMDSRVSELLAAIGLESAAAKFAEEEIGYDDLAHLSDQDLEGLGLKMGPRRRLRAELEKRAKAGTESPAAEAPAETPSEAPAETPAETPPEAPAEASSETPAETPSETPSEAPAEASSETPAEETPSEASSETPTEETPSEAPSEETPSETPAEETPSEEPSSEETPAEEPAPEAPPEPPPPPPPPPRVRESLVPALDAAWDAATTGWHGETLPKGMRRGAASPVCIWDTGQGLEIEMVYVPAGEFQMGTEDGPGDEKPRHKHALKEAFYIGRTPTTWKEYRAYCKAKGAKEPKAPGWGAKADHPVVNLAWQDAANFCAWAGLALPTEPQWEKAAAGVEGYKYPWGDDVPDESRCAFSGHSKYGGKSTAPVGSFAEHGSAYGAQDMAGNVCEWCADWYESNVYARYETGDVRPPARGDLRSVRGGGYSDTQTVVRNQWRGKKFPSFWGETVGLRPVKVVK
jgi:formylglycine-generating enzyme required for sulfatase activity